MGVQVRQKLKGKGKPWWIFISHNGKRASRKIGDKTAAEAVASQIRIKLQAGEFGFEEKKPVPTFKEIADSWIKITVPATCKESTAQDYKTLLDRHVLPEFGALPITEINRGKIKDFLLKKANKGYAGSTINHMRNTVSGVLNKALDDEIIQVNPAISLGKYIPKSARGVHIKPLSAKKLRTLLNTVAEHYPEHYTLFLLLARTGMRIGEAVALQWPDINLKKRYIHVQRSIVRDKVSTPKSGKSRRVDISPQLAEAFKREMQGIKLKEIKPGENKNQYLFTNANGNPIDKNNWRRRVFSKAVKKAEITGCRIHDLRHTYATLRIAKGDNIGDVSNQLGHHSVKLTLDIYYHWIPGKQKAEVDALDDPALRLPDAPYMHPKVKRGLTVNG